MLLDLILSLSLDTLCRKFVQSVAFTARRGYIERETGNIVLQRSHTSISDTDDSGLDVSVTEGVSFLYTQEE
jgi:hypothetical protein